MIIIVKPGQYIAGIFRDPADAARYLADIPIGTWSIMNVDLDYPFILVESTQRTPTGAHATFAALANGSDLARVTGTIYHIAKDYVPSVPWHDLMGALPHSHHD